jgi:hypothetical protein
LYLFECQVLINNKPVNEYEDDENNRDVPTAEKTNNLKPITKDVEVITGGEIDGRTLLIFMTAGGRELLCPNLT